MILHTKVTLIKDELPSSIVDAILTIAPETDDDWLMYIDMDYHSEKCQKILATLADAGIHPYNHLASYNGPGFPLQLERQYADEDLAGASLLKPYPIHSDGGHEDKKGIFILSGEYGMGSNIYFANTSELICTDAGRKAIEALGASEIAFKPAHRPRPKSKENLWRITTSVTMPRLSPTMVLIDASGKPYEENSTESCYPRESRQLPEAVISQAEFRYRSFDMASLPSFDLAVTHEPLFAASVHHPIVSQRLYRVLRDLNLETYWVPVRIES